MKNWPARKNAVQSDTRDGKKAKVDFALTCRFFD